MTRLTKPLFADRATGTVANIIEFTMAGGHAAARQPGRKPTGRSQAQQEHNANYAAAHAEWMLLTKQEVTVKKRRYQRRIPGWPDYWRMWPTPQAPTDLTATAAEDKFISLEWSSAATNHTEFEVQRKQGESGAWSALTTTGKTTTTYDDKTAEINITYGYRVRATNLIRQSGWSNTAQAMIAEEILVPASPSNLTATATSQATIDLSWTDNSTNEAGFRLYRKIGAGGTWALRATKVADETAHVDEGLQASTTYIYRITANNTSGESGPSNETSATTQAIPAPAQPTNLSATAISDSEIDLTWTDNATSETTYYVERKIGTGGSWSEVQTLNANSVSYNNTSLAAETEYFYRVRCWNSGGYSTYSNTASATTQSGNCVLPVELTYFEEGAWTTACQSVHEPGSYARYYSFTLTETTTIWFATESAITNIMFILAGHGMSGSVITQDDESGGSGNALIEYELDAGEYTLEFATQESGITGDFVLLMDTTW